ncbi:MAG: Rrf2 family transcriptional regulator [Novosphingobium sp.]|uniref:RrF2 family transcriptional regulator n=1 Tax=Novosphingobium sp. TaxID=1874826 RepID=UPI002636436F|nr:Rrf2 family transcriptional regulator [Novosphingobium sp.]MCP5386772.1 Rrf2 family transcriptional regulator [Novosphingobium sp.]
MRLTRYTDYAFRVLFHVAVNDGRPVPIAEIARTYDISQNHLVKVVHELVKTGYLRSIRGRSGGVLLARPAEQIGLGEVVRHTEPDMRLLDCVGCLIASACSLPRPMQEAINAFVEVLDKYTLADIVNESDGLERILAGTRD